MSEIRVLREPRTYDRDNFETSYFSDLYRYQQHNDVKALERLKRGASETLVDAEERGIKLRDVEGRALNTTSTSGGDFLPPLYFGDLYAEFRRARRVTASLVWNRVLPPTGNSITVPRVTGGSSDAAQTADNANIANADPTTNLLTVPVCTAAGYVDMSRQIFERAEPGLDEIVIQDLYGSYGNNVNNYVINGSNSNGQPKGLLSAAGISVAFTTGSPTVGLAYPKLVDAARQIHENVFEPANAIVMTARRWGWFLDALDSQNRPLVVPDSDGILFDLVRYLLSSGNAGPLFNESTNIPSVGTLLGIPVYVDETLPKVQGAGSNQDVILVGSFKRSILWEDQNGPRVFEFNTPGSQSATLRVTCYGSFAFTGERFTKATAAITGTGLIAPTF